MDEVRTYIIEVQGRVRAEEINPSSPIKITPAGICATSTRFKITTDQSGFIGLLRHLHTRGVVLLSAASGAAINNQEE